ncbi:response regulator transcription factor [Krasilnikovia sp. MM14-A1259]
MLVVDDEPGILEVLTATLALAGFATRAARTCAEARRMAAEFRPEIAVLDVMLPDGSGLDLCRSLRDAGGDLGVLFLSARDAETDKLDGLSIGDGYLTKPFSVAEVVARLHVLRRRMDAPPPSASRPVLRAGDLCVDEDGHRVSRAGAPIELTPTEFKVLVHLLRHAGVVVSKQQLLSHVWGHGFCDAGAVEKIVSKLRRKVDRAGHPALLHTVRGFGYTVRESPP